MTCSDRYIFCYYKYVACPVLGDFGAILAVVVSDLLAFLVLVSPSKKRWGKWHIPHLLCWLLLFLPWCSMTQAPVIISGFSRAHLLAWRSNCSVEKKSSISSCCCWISAILDICHMNWHAKTCVFGVILYIREDMPPKMHIQDRRRGSRNQFCLHVTEHLEELNLQFWLWIKP